MAKSKKTAPGKKNSSKERNSSKDQGVRSKQNDARSSRTKGDKKGVEDSRSITARKASTTDQVSTSKPGTVTVRPRMLKFITWVLIIVATVIMVDFAVQYINNDYSIAMVNGSRIPASEYQTRLEDAYGNVIATQMINEELIRQKAEEEGVTVTDEEVEDVIDKTREELGGEDELNTALEANGLTLDTYRRNLRIQLMAEKLVVPDPTEEELMAFFDEFKAAYFGEDAVYDDLKDEVAEAYVKQRFNELSGAWLNELREGSDIQNNASEKPAYGILEITRGLIEDMNNRLDSE